MYETATDPDLRLAAFAHEVNNLLTAARGSAELAQRSQDPAHTRQLMVRVVARLDDLAGLTQAAMAEAGGTPGSYEAAHADCEAAAIVAEIYRCLQPVTGQSPVVVNVEAMKLAIPGEALGRVILNLIINAQRAIADNPDCERNSGSITIGGWQRGKHGYLRVEDDGPGVVPTVAARLFNPWATFTTGATQPQEQHSSGHGLGLWISRGLVERYGGSLELEATDGGASFLIRVPLAGGIEREASRRRSA